MTMKAVGTAAMEMVQEVEHQFVEVGREFNPRLLRHVLCFFLSSFQLYDSLSRAHDLSYTRRMASGALD